MDDPLIGTEIGRYRITSLLGEGGMGRVYLAVQPAIGSRVAIKILSEQCARSPELLDRFFSEAKAVNLVRHENIVSVLDLSTLGDGRPFIVMEFIEGQTLGAIVRTQRAPAAPLGGLMQVMGEVLSALQAAHAIGIVHRDLKPDNVLVTGEGHAKVLDFGIAKLAPGLHDQSSRTKTGALLGTPAYMAPEQISGAGTVDARADIYAAGVLLFEAVTGRVPFTGATIFDVMRAQMDQAPPAPRTLRPDLPQPIEDVILTALAKDPAHRFQSAQAMAQALVHAAASLPADQWRPLSTRGGPRISASGAGQPTPQLTPPSPSAVGMPPSGLSPSAAGAMPPSGLSPSAAAPPTYPASPPTEARTRKTGLVVGALALVAVAVGVTLFVVGRSGSKDGGGSNEVGSNEIAVVDQPAPAPADAAAIVPSADAASSPGVVGVAVADAATPGPGHHSHGPADAPLPALDAGAPIVVNGGSAADHAVHIGDNVQIGSNVIIGSQTPASLPHEVTAPADFDPKHFDPVAYLPKALALAQKLAPDAQLTQFEFDPVFPDGRVDLTMEGRDREYNFRSPARSAHPADVPKNIAVDRPCMIHVEVSARQVTATIRQSDSCDAHLVHAPRCHYAGVWKQASAAGAPGDVVARIGWLFDEKWFFDTDLDGNGKGMTESLPDRCP